MGIESIFTSVESYGKLKVGCDAMLRWDNAKLLADNDVARYDLMNRSRVEEILSIGKYYFARLENGKIYSIDWLMRLANPITYSMDLELRKN